MNNIALKPEASFDELLAAARNKFGAIKFESVKIGGKELEIAQVVDMPAYLDSLIDKIRGGKKIELPLWAKIWPSSMVLGVYLLKFKPVEKATFLEVGAGGGICGLLAASRGYNVVLSDVDDDALLFCRLNAVRNNLDDKISVKKIDFCSDEMNEKFNYIIGSEVLYQENIQIPFYHFIEKHLSKDDGSETLLAMDKKRSGRLFFEEAQKNYRLMRQEVSFAGNETEGKTLISLVRMGAL
ncbi:methyltransferase [Maridesulfovibrio ferrireducens]|uniref:class I SAM-dependent methyltransferase n=1 Tax=Maridesulfovibrio ferrireducens TaxID=246191 RepID=UPI001A222E46|nr:methyltransferase [Maridesulfovibrio ferrireducens]MBI9111514.1 methyltransferase [Maridesulfovibrio ferrireducens]